MSSEVTNPQIFRSVNVLGSIAIAWTVRHILLLDRKNSHSKVSNVVANLSHDLHSIHNTINICLFPPLFFFYGLYYTDVLSALSVLFAYQCYLEQCNGWIVLFVGLLSLLFRQTNIFWVSLFLGGLAFCSAIPKGRPSVKFSIEPTFYEVIRSSWQHAYAFDPLVSQASFEGFMYFPV